MQASAGLWPVLQCPAPASAGLRPVMQFPVPASARSTQRPVHVSAGAELPNMKESLKRKGRKRTGHRSTHTALSPTPLNTLSLRPHRTHD